MLHRHPSLLPIAGLSGLLLVASCSTDLASFAERHTTAAERAFAASYLHLLAEGQLDSAFGLLAPTLRHDEARRAMGAVSPVLALAHLDSLQTIGVNVATSPDARTVNLSYEMPTRSEQWAVANVATREASGEVRVVGFSAYLTPARLEVMHAFTLPGKSPTHYTWLALAILMPVLCGTIAVGVARTKEMPRRWLWVLVALFAAPVFSLNWTSGESSVRMLSFMLLGAGVVRASPAAPWALSWAIPTGALVAYLRLRAWRSRRTAATDRAT